MIGGGRGGVELDAACEEFADLAESGPLISCADAVDTALSERPLGSDESVPDERTSAGMPGALCSGILPSQASAFIVAWPVAL